MPLQPWWIISLYKTGEEGSEFLTELINDNLLRWSVVSKVMPDENAPRWWFAETASPAIPDKEEDFVRNLAGMIHNPLSTAGGNSPLIAGEISTSQLNVAIVGTIESEETMVYLHGLGRLLRMKQDELFTGTNLQIIGILDIPLDTTEELEDGVYLKRLRFLSELDILMHHNVAACRPFDYFFILQDRNNSIHNEGGYTHLSSEARLHLTAQCLFHLMIGGNVTLARLKDMHKTSYFSMGSVGIVYDRERYQEELGKNVGDIILQSFKTEAKSPFVSEDQARSALWEIEKRSSVQNLFEAFTLAGDLPSFSFESAVWENPKDEKGRLVSPWHFHKRELLYIYFHRYLRDLPIKLSEYTRIFLTVSLQNLRSYLQKKTGDIWSSSDINQQEASLKQTLHKMVRDILAGNYGRARTIGQVRNALDLLIKACAPDEISRHPRAFEKSDKLQVFKIPGYLKEFYRAAPETLTEEHERKLYDYLVDTVRSHPLPLGLLARAALLSPISVFLGYHVLDWLSPSVINMEWVFRMPALIVVFFGILPFLFALWRYRVKTLNLLWKQVKTYIAAVVKHVQTKASNLVLKAVSGVIDIMGKYAEEMKGYIDEFVHKFTYPKSTRISPRETAFQFPVTGSLAIPGKPSVVNLLPKGMPWHLLVNGTKKLLKDLTDEDKNLLVCEALNADRENSVENTTVLWRLLSQEFPIPEDSLLQAAALLRAFSEQRWSSIPEGIDELWTMTDERSVQEMARIAQAIKTIAYPPVLFAQGETPPPVTFECKCANSSTIKDVLGIDACHDLSVGLVTTVGGFLPIPSEGLGKLATIQSMGMKVNIRSLTWDNPSAIFTLATSDLDDRDTTIASYVNAGVSLPVVSEDVRAKVEQIKGVLGLTCQDTFATQDL